MSESVPNYVTCRCKHCDGGIEFDANELTPENSSFLESVPEVSAKLKEANTKELMFEEIVKAAEQAAVLVLVY